MQLVQNPFLLKLLTTVYQKNQHDLPVNRGQLFKTVVNTLIAREHQRLHLTDDEPDQLIKGLCQIAFSMQTGQTEQLQTEAEEPEENRARTVLPKTEVEALLGARLFTVACSANLLIRGEQVRFAHHLFQEYFAAQFMDEKFQHDPNWKPEKIWLRESWWEKTNWEVATILWAGLYNDDCTPVVKWLADAQPELAARCLDEKESGAVLAESTRHATLERLREKWLTRLTNVESDPHPQARAAIGRALGQLKLDNRKGVGLKDDLPDIDWVKIPGGEGEFIYGEEKQADDPEWYTPAKPQRLPLPATFWMSRYPVTNAQFQAFIDHIARHNDADRWFAGLAATEDERRIGEPRFNFPNHPRETVNWYQALAFCRWLSWCQDGRPDRTPDLKRIDQWAVRLPLETEWERAARGTDGQVYAYGDGYDATKAKVNETGIGQTSAVGIFADCPSPEGLFDLTGNVWEWCLSEYKKPEVKPNLDVRKEKLGTDKVRVLRGGSWFVNDVVTRAADRNYGHPASRDSDVGFRLVSMRPPSALL